MILRWVSTPSNYQSLDCLNECKYVPSNQDCWVKILYRNDKGA